MGNREQRSGIRGQRSEIRDQRGFTLMELLVVIGVMGLLTVVSMTTFYRSIRGSSRVEIKKSLDAGVQHIISSVSRDVRGFKVASVSGADRAACLSLGSVSGSSLILDKGELQHEYRLENNNLMSGAAPLNGDGLVVSSLSFVWKCKAGVFDTVDVSFDASIIGDDGTALALDTYDFGVIVRNSGN